MSEQKNIFLTIIFLLLFTANGCREHEIIYPGNEEELITTLELTFMELNGVGEPIGSPLVFTARDKNASGAMHIDDIALNAHTVYSLELKVLDESKTPADNLSDQILEEGTDHQFFFQVPELQLAIEYADADEHGNPIGLKNKVQVGNDGAGSMTVILRHQPDKNGDGVSGGKIEHANGDTDIETIFAVVVSE